MNGTNKKNTNIREYVITGNVIAVLICFAALVASLQPVEAFGHSMLFVVTTLCLTIFLSLAIVYISKKEKINLGIAEPPKVLNYIFFTGLVIAIALIANFAKEDRERIMLLFFIPVSVSAISHGKNFSLYIAIISSGFIVLINKIDFFVERANWFTDINLIYFIIMLYTAWLVGGLASMEKDRRVQLLHLANYDELTGLANHRRFHEKLDEMLRKAKDSNQELSLIIADIDHFKFYNDAHGHQMGDEVLRVLGNLFKELVNEPNVPARYGGEEFAFIISSLTTPEVIKLAEKMRTIVEQTPFYGIKEQPGGKLTLSIGIASFPKNAETKEELIRTADQALYKAKFMSRNKVEIYFSVLDELKDKIDHSEQELFNSVRTLISIINAKDRYTFGHSERVIDYGVRLARRLMLPEEEIAVLKYGSFLHDIGKIEIERDILNKSESLTKNEWEILKQHPVWGAEIIKPLPSLQRVVPIVLYHHENFDGTGYPIGLKGEEIPLTARIIRIIDSFDAMTTDRPYKKGMSKVAALNELSSFSGTYYDPELVLKFRRMIEEDLLKDFEGWREG